MTIHEILTNQWTLQSLITDRSTRKWSLRSHQPRTEHSWYDRLCKVVKLRHLHRRKNVVVGSFEMRNRSVPAVHAQLASI